MDVFEQLFDEVAAAEEVGGVVFLEGGQALVRVAEVCLLRRRRPQRFVLEEDLVFDLPELGRRLDAEFVAEDEPGPLVGAQCVGLPAGANQCRHQQTPQPLPIGVLIEETLDLAGEHAVASQLEIGGDAVLDRSHAQLIETRGLGCQRVAVVGDPLERSSPPEVGRFGEHPGGVGRIAVEHRPALGDERLEAQEVHRVAVHHQRIAGRR